jgi:isoleucyl-tRNA synthetase
MYADDSVHLQNYPKLDNFGVDSVLLDTMDRVRNICGCALFLRDRNNLRIRLPLNRITIIARNTDDLEEFSSIIMEEINVKSVEFLNNIEDFSNNRLVLNFQRLGNRVGAKIPELIRAAENNRWKITPDGTLMICGLELAGDEFSVQLRAKSKDVFPVEGHNILIKLDLEVTRELRCEGAARDLVRVIQQFRKDSNLDVSDRIELFIRTDYPLLRESIDKYRSYIEEQTLANSLALVSDSYFSCLFSTGDEIDKTPVKIGFNLIK